MNLIQKIRDQLASKKTGSTSFSQFGAIGIVPETPVYREKKGEKWVCIGEDNLLPQKLSDFKYGSAIHNAILSTASDMIAGDGTLLDGAKTKEESEIKYSQLDATKKAEYDNYLKNPHGKLSTEKIRKKLSFDLKEQGCFACELIFNKDHDRIAARKYLDVRNLRPGKKEKGEIKTWFYSEDWSQYKKDQRFKPIEIPVYDRGNTEDMNQLYFDKIGNFDYYGVPDYIGALTWIQIDFKMGIFHLSNLENGMNPSMLMKFYQVPSSEEDKLEVLSQIKRQYTSAVNTGRHMVTFSDGKELAPDITPVNVSGLDKQMIVVAELADKKILTGHKLTSPLLAGISVSGQIGGNVEFEKAALAYQNTRIKPLSKMISDFENEVLDFNGTGLKMEINPYRIF